jgi:predicted RNA methylase
MMAAAAGARRVVAIEKSAIVSEARGVIQSNGLSSKIEIINGLAEDYCPTDELADIVISEWMGYSLIFESMLGSVLSVRDRCLREDGIMVPQRA